MKPDLNNKSIVLRKKMLLKVYNTKASHIGSALSVLDVLVFLYNDFMNFDPDKNNDLRDRLILSKGHASLALYSVLNDLGVISDGQYNSYYTEGSYLGAHVTNTVPGIELSTGSLGHGLSVGAGIALAAKIDKKLFRTFVVLGDGECNEGAVWEAAAFASSHALSNLIVVVDYNKLQGFGRTDEVLDMTNLAGKWAAFGWTVQEIDGHDFNQMREAFNKQTTKPLVIICNTVKGKGVDFMEDKLEWHYKSPKEDELWKAIDGLK